MTQLAVSTLEARLLDQVQASVVVTDPDGAVLLWNRHAELLHGWSRSEALGRHVSDLIVSPSEAEAAAETARRVRAGETWEGDRTVRRRDGRRVVLRVTESPLYEEDGTLAGIMGISVDITERTRAEQWLAAQHEIARALAESEALAEVLRRILAAAGEGLDWDAGVFWELDPEADALLCSASWAAPSAGLSQLEETARELRLARGEGLAGTAWATGEPAWAGDAAGSGGPSLPTVGAIRLQGGLAVPVRLPGDELAVVELMSLEPREPNGDALRLVVAAASQIVQFESRRRAEDGLRRLAGQQTAVSDLGLRALGGASLAELMDEAVAHVARELDVELAKILELQPDRSALLLRSGIGWREGLVGTATVGAGPDSQAGYTLSSAQPVVVGDLRSETRFTGPSLLRGHGAVSGISVVIHGPDGPYGVLGAHTVRRRAFTHDDVAFLQSVANVLGAAIDRDASERALRRSAGRLSLALRAGQMGTWDWNLRTGEVTWSENLERIHGLQPGAFGGTFEDFAADVHPDDAERVRRTVEQALAEDEPGEYNLEYRIVRPDDSVRWVEARGHVLRLAGEPVAMTGVCMDVTERKRAESERSSLLAREQDARAAAEGARDHLAFLAEAGEILGSSLSVPKTLAKLARLLVPRLCDWCAIDLEEDGSVNRVVVAHADPAREEILRELQQRFPPERSEPHGAAEVIRSGEPEIIEEVTDEQLAARSRNEAHLELVRRLGILSFMRVPLVARGRAIGAISLGISDSGRRFGGEDLALVQDLARRAALAVDNARLYQERSRVARTLQRSLLPPQLPEIPGVEVAASFRPAGEGNEVGGDFYDLFEIAEGSWAVAIGDVCGKGAEAAALTGLARNAIRVGAMRERSPKAVLSLLNEAILRQDAGGRFCTVAFCRLELGASRACLVAACGGHPLPLVLRAGGALETVECRGSLLGVYPDPELADRTVELGPGDAAVLYTDGVTETRRDDADFGEGRLLEALRSAAGASAEEIVRAIEEALQAFQPEPSRDDVAVVVLRIAP